MIKLVLNFSEILEEIQRIQSQKPNKKTTQILANTV